MWWRVEEVADLLGAEEEQRLQEEEVELQDLVVAAVYP